MELKTLVVENIWLKSLTERGWGNGYVFLPKNHKYYNLDYDDIPVNVHGGLTYGKVIDKNHCFIEKGYIDISYNGLYCIGFDTFHHGDTMENWSKERVMIETEKLKMQLEKE